MTPLTKKLIKDKWKAYRAKNWTRFNYLKAKTKKEIIKAKTIWTKKQKETIHGLWKITEHISGKAQKNDLQNLITECETSKALAEKLRRQLTTQ